MGQVFPINFRLWRYLGLPEAVALEDLSRPTPAVPPRAIPGSGIESEHIFHTQTGTRSASAWTGVAPSFPGSPKRLLVADDGGPTSQAALADANVLGKKYGAELKVIHVNSPDIPQALEASAVTFGADWIVMGTHGRSLKEEVKLGSVSETVMKEATVPVWIANQPSPLKIERLLVAVDHSPQALQVAAQGLRLALDFDAELCLLHVETSDPQTHTLTEIFQRIAWKKTTVKDIVSQDSVADTLLQCAHDIDADLIVMGTHREERAHVFLASGVAAEVVRKSPRRVLVLHPYETTQFR